MGTRWTPALEEELRARWASGETMSAIAKAMGVTRNSIIGKSNRLSLQFHSGAARHFSETAPSVVEGRTRYPAMVREPGRNGVLKPGIFNRKLGSTITKGRWKGFPILALTLEERATCPRSCKIWVNCYGNGSHGAIRYKAGDTLLRALTEDLTRLQRIHPEGFAVRLHSLGDFNSMGYFEFWRDALLLYPALRIFGYTARQEADPVGAAIANLRRERWDRFAVRTSGASGGASTVVVPSLLEAPADAIVCPAQHNPAGKNRSCSTCAICWSHSAREKVVAFLAH
jgi:hypothetical protein